MQRRGSAPGLTLGGRRYSRRFLAIMGIALLLVVGAIAGGSGEGGDPEPTATTVAQVAPTDAPEPTAAATNEPEPTDVPPTAEPTKEPAEEEVANSRCEPVDDALVDGISEGLTVDGGGSLRNAQAVRSGDYKKVWFIAADIQGPGLEGSEDIGIWATNSLVGEGLIMAVGGYATEFSDWGDGGQTDAQLSTSDDGAQEARGCVEAAGE